MTLDEATIALKYHFPVEIDEKLNEKYGIEGAFFVSSLTKYLPKYEKNFSYRVAIQKNERTVYEVDIKDIKVPVEFEQFYKDRTADMDERVFEAAIKKKFISGKEQAEICADVCILCHAFERDGVK